jgi:hypothetical protein
MNLFSSISQVTIQKLCITGTLRQVPIFFFFAGIKFADPNSMLMIPLGAGQDLPDLRTQRQNYVNLRTENTKQEVVVV